MQNTIPAARRKDTLCKFFRAIPGARVTIETTNNDLFTGDITNVDLNFNFTLSNAIFRPYKAVVIKKKVPITKDDPPTRFETIIVSGRHIRYVSFEEEINVGKAVDTQKKNEMEAYERYKEQFKQRKPAPKPAPTRTRAEKPIVHDVLGKRKRE